jgi:hypothetical protein
LVVLALKAHREYLCHKLSNTGPGEEAGMGQGRSCVGAGAEIDLHAIQLKEVW